MMAGIKICFLALLSFATGSVTQLCSETVVVETDKGAVAGCRRVDTNGSVYASFRGVPYAKQPLGELRFQELLPADPWQDTLNATEEGPVCPQYDKSYENITYPDRIMSESCIHANIHVPYYALPKKSVHSVGVPIIVFIHGGGFGYGSGDSDLHGPEYLVSKGVIVITFNYRINVFGFLSLNSPVIPGNNGIRDVITLLRWVQANAARFGGNHNDVTLAGQSAGSAITHILSMIPAAQGLFHRIILMSLTASPLVYSASPTYAQTITNLFLTTVGINSTDPEDTHRQLIEMPLETLMTANAQVQDQLGTVVTFPPVVETTAPNFTTILDIDPDEMIKQGRGNNIPAMIGFTTVEGEIFRPIFENIDIVSVLEANLTSTVVYPKVALSSTPEVLADVGRRIQEKYFPTVTLDNYIKYFTDAYFIYPAINLAKIRAEQAAVPTYLYQFSYNNDNNVLKRLNTLTYVGATHIEDQTYLMRVNTGLPATQPGQISVEDPMVDRMTSFVASFIKNGAPTDDSEWKPVSSDDFTYQDIATPDLNDYRNHALTKSQQEMYKFFLSIEKS